MCRPILWDTVRLRLPPWWRLRISSSSTLAKPVGSNCFPVGAGCGVVFRANGFSPSASSAAGSSYWFVYFGIAALIVAAILAARRRIAERLPSFEILTT